MPYDINKHKEFIKSEVSPLVPEIEKSCVYPKALIKKLAGEKYLTPTFPAEYGGLNLNPLEYGVFTETVGKTCQASRALLTVHNSLAGETILRWGSEGQKKDYLFAMSSGEKIGAFALSEPKIGSDAKNVSTKYEKKNDSYIINGKKKWISFGGIADFFLTIAANENNVSAFLIDRNTDGITVEEMKGLIAGNGVHIAQIEFNNVEVSSSKILGGEGNGLNYIVSTALDHGRYSIAWGGIGIAQAALEAMVTYSRKREQFGEKIYKHDAIQKMIGESTARFHSARALCEKVAKMRSENHPDSIIETNIAKYITSKAAVDISNAALQVHGGNGCWNEYPVEKLFREARILEIIEGTSQVQEKLIASFALRRYFVKDLYTDKDF
jgi:alkylation response protein AidB-like acyl-CoA dehydrogenase